MAVAVETLPINGIESLQEGVKGATVDPVQIKSGTVRGSLTFAETGCGTLTFGQVSGDIRLRGPLSEDTVTLGVLTRVTGATSQWGRETLQGDFGLFPSCVEHEAVYSADTDYLAVALPATDVEYLKHAEGLPQRPRFWSTGAMYRGEAQTTKELVRKGQAIAAIVRECPRVLAVAEARKAMMADLVDQFFFAFNCAGALVDVSASSVSAPHALVRRAEDLCLEGPERSLSIRDLCCHLGVSERTLRRAFVSVVGVPPRLYLRNLRLTRVRQMLALAESGSTRVSDIAMQHGFWELGRFAAEYRQHFGELPSQTLARRPS